MALIGYARVSVLEQDPWRQNDELQAAGCERVFTDRASGSAEERLELARALDHLRRGDTLVVRRLDRLGRSLRDLVDTICALGECGVGLRSLQERIDTTTADGKVVFQVAASLAEFELDVVRERTQLAAVGIREPRPSALAEAVKALPPRRSPTADSTPVPVGPVAAPAGEMRKTRSWNLHRALLAIPLLVMVAAGALAFHAGRSGAQAAPPALSQSASNGDLELHFPAGWRRDAPAAAFSSLRLADPIVLTADGPRGAVVIAGVSHATGATLLTSALTKRLDRRLRAPASVRLGRLAVLRHAGLGVRGLTRRMTVFVTPTSRGALTLACLARPADIGEFSTACERVAQSTRLLRSDALPLGPSKDYQRGLTALLGPLDAKRRQERAELASAPTAQAQGQAAQQLSTAFAEARAIGMGGSRSPREAAAHARILEAIAGARDAYERMAEAARAGSAGQYDDAREGVRGAENRLRSALRALRPLGYVLAAARPYERVTTARRPAGS